MRGPGKWYGGGDCHVGAPGGAEVMDGGHMYVWRWVDGYIRGGRMAWVGGLSAGGIFGREWDTVVGADCAYTCPQMRCLLVSSRNPSIAYLATSKHPLVCRVDRIHACRLCMYLLLARAVHPTVAHPCPMWGGVYPTPPVALPHPPRNWLIAAATSRAA